MFSFLKPAPDAKVKVPAEKVVGTYRLRQTGVLLSICIGYIGYYIIRLIFTTEQNDIMKAYWVYHRRYWVGYVLFWDWLRDFQAVHGGTE